MSIIIASCANCGCQRVRRLGQFQVDRDASSPLVVPQGSGLPLLFHHGIKMLQQKEERNDDRKNVTDVI